MNERKLMAGNMELALEAAGAVLLGWQPKPVKQTNQKELI